MARQSPVFLAVGRGAPAHKRQSLPCGWSAIAPPTAERESDRSLSRDAPCGARRKIVAQLLENAQPRRKRAPPRRGERRVRLRKAASRAPAAGFASAHQAVGSTALSRGGSGQSERTRRNMPFGPRIIRSPLTRSQVGLPVRAERKANSTAMTSLAHCFLVSA